MIFFNLACSVVAVIENTFADTLLLLLLSHCFYSTCLYFACIYSDASTDVFLVVSTAILLSARKVPYAHTNETIIRNKVMIAVIISLIFILKEVIHRKIIYYNF